MSDIPPDRRSSHELYEQFRVAGARKARLDRQVQRRRRLQLIPGPVLGAVLGFLVVGGGFAVGTKVFTGDDGTTLTGRDGGAQVRQAPADRRLARASTEDPSVAGARWGLLTYQNTNGATCVVPGRLVGDRVGRVEDGRFAAYDASPPGAMCGVPAREPLLLWTRSMATGDGARAVLYGIADRSVTALRMTRGDAPVPIAPDGTFLVVGAGEQAFRGRTLRVTRGGVTRDVAL
ncbi:hypothetical protein [Conexibacter woesei]|uniref:hypothetical protein n=1 Tax=Conexibacter woesei TaxID=191495 RepID=UPI0004049002|nr:hypothetical protein [Conexibacter woesei]